MHNPTIKYIKGDKFKHDGKFGLPFDIEKGSTPKISKKADKKENTSKLKSSDRKFINSFYKDNEDEILEYWDLNPNILSDAKRMVEIQNKIMDKYSTNIKKSPNQ